jgi:polygalacturonase
MRPPRSRKIPFCSMSGLLGALLLCGTVIAAEPGTPGTWDPRMFGAMGDGQTVDTKAIQASIDACTAAGGGVVRLSGGVFLSGTIVLRNNVTLHIDAGATLLGSRNIDDYPSMPPKIVFLYRDRFTKALIQADQAENIGVEGRGVIDGQGQHFHASRGDDALRPYLIRFSECRNIRVRDVTLLTSARWGSHYLACENVTIDGISIRARIRENRDGIDVDSCARVRIANCDIVTGDDAIVLKATAMQPCRHVAVINCTLSSQASALKLGTESNGGFEDVTFSNCTVYDTDGSGINLGMVDGGTCDRVMVSNITMNNVNVPIFIRLGNRARPIPNLPPPGMGRMRNVVLTNIQAGGAGDLGCSITGLPGFPLENVTLQNVRIRFAGGGTATDATRPISERDAAYPSEKMFGKLPAYGFFCRHARNLRLQQIDVSVEKSDSRPAFVLDDVHNTELRDCIGLSAHATPGLVWLKQCKDISLRGCRIPNPLNQFLQVDGGLSSNIVLTGNDFTKVQKILDHGPDVPGDAISLLGNRMNEPTAQ